MIVTIDKLQRAQQLKVNKQFRNEKTKQLNLISTTFNEGFILKSIYFFKLYQLINNEWIKYNNNNNDNYDDNNNNQQSSKLIN